MGKSIRSKRKKRLRTIKREIVEPHYDVKERAKMAAQEAALAAPKIEIPQKRQALAISPSRGRTGVPDAVPMSVDSGDAMTITDTKLKPTRVIGKRKRDKSRKRDVSSKRKKNVKF